MAAAPQRNCTNLSDKIADIRIGTTVQGAGTLEVHVIDPWWKLLHRDTEGVCFIDAQPDGYLWPPIEVNWPPGLSDAWFRLCAVQAATDLTQANMILTFEDVLVAELRAFGRSGFQSE